MRRTMTSLGFAFSLMMALVSCKTEPPTVAKDPAPGAADPAKPPANAAALMDPSLAKEQAPPMYKAQFVTTKGAFTIQVTRDWSPNAADRFYNLVKIGYFNGVRFFRVVDGFMAQFGIHGDPAVSAKWRTVPIKDEPVIQGNKRGRITFAKSGPDTRTNQVFINFVDNSRLDPMGFPSFGEVIDGMNVVDALYKGYGEGAPMGKGPDQGRMQAEGNAYLMKEFAQLDWIKEAAIAP
jgi:peptidyl-prolyl cis-trans isomerase A (cyclophilin A)